MVRLKSCPVESVRSFGSATITTCHIPQQERLFMKSEQDTETWARETMREISGGIVQPSKLESLEPTQETPVIHGSPVNVSLEARDSAVAERDNEIIRSFETTDLFRARAELAEAKLKQAYSLLGELRKLTDTCMHMPAIASNKDAVFLLGSLCDDLGFVMGAAEGVKQ